MMPSESFLCPPHIRESLQRYSQEHIATGDFLRAILSNNLYESVARADHINMELLPFIVGFIVNNLPSGCYGSAEKVDRWLAKSSVKLAKEF